MPILKNDGVRQWGWGFPIYEMENKHPCLKPPMSMFMVFQWDVYIYIYLVGGMFYQGNMFNKLYKNVCLRPPTSNVIWMPEDGGAELSRVQLLLSCKLNMHFILGFALWGSPKPKKHHYRFPSHGKCSTGIF